MVKRPGFQRGDIVIEAFNPVVGREEQGIERPALVLSTRDFNRLGMVLVAPITQGGNFAREAGFAVSLTGAGTRTQGVALINQVRMLDLSSRAAKIIEKAPEEVTDEALAILDAIIS
ncbi:type II toxin-antitoxin system ChpB family toxin [Sodalis ligni]|uniref:type II toxin-antitoxin system ChpB family toxin n=1 Tax=Sodalis ligni TaxID=2697027 RepID=UPI00193F7C72|nr:type II toxin-antitoxin system ChpB family toxin [Sodalis ligni]QWA09373.1 type II toxin-antitoxin system ChpB family toxin [Sodalis ligni]